MNTIDWITSASAFFALLVALFAAGYARRQAKAAERYGELGTRQAESYEGAQSAIMWREQIFALYDRGLNAGQIRYIMHLEGGGPGYEGWNGRIDDLIRDVPRQLTDATTAANAAAMSCDVMPTSEDSCTGPCQETLANSGCLEYRDNDSESPNKSGRGSQERAR
jgi:hypothetical protein